MQLQLHYTNYTTPQLQLHYTTTTATAALHHTTSSSCGWGDRPGDHCNHCSHSKTHSSNHLSVHQWIRSAIHDSQQPTSPIGFLFLKLPPPPCAVLLVWCSPSMHHENTVRCLKTLGNGVTSSHLLSCAMRLVIWLEEVTDTRIETVCFRDFNLIGRPTPWSTRFWRRCHGD